MSHSKSVDTDRRRFLTLGTSVVGGAGIAVAAWPFVASLRPSERAKALGAPITIDIGKMQPGQRVIAAWRGKPVWVVSRTAEMIQALPTLRSQLRDPNSEQPQQPDYARNEHRSIKPEILVMVGSCTHLGCSPIFRPEHPAKDIDANWQGGFYCPCHGSKFDLAGRVYRDVPAPLNMVVPPYRFEGEHSVVIGEDDTGAA